MPATGVNSIYVLWNARNKEILKEKKTENWESVGNSRGGYAAVPKACVLQIVEFARVELPCVATYNVGVRCSRV